MDDARSAVTMTYREQQIAACLARPYLALVLMACSIGFWDQFAGEVPDTVLFPYIVWNRDPRKRNSELVGLAYNIAHARMLAASCDAPRVLHRGGIDSQQQNSKQQAQTMLRGGF